MLGESRIVHATCKHGEPQGGLHGLDAAEDGMPTDRTVRCPGWRKK